MSIKEIKSEELFIFRRMADGEKNALRFFFDKYYTDLCNYVNCFVHDAETAEELVQDIFVYLWEKREKIELHSSVKSYLYFASKNKSLNYIRNKKIKSRVLKNYNEQQTSIHDEGDNLDLKQLREIIAAALEKLPERCREIYLLSRNEELSHKQIAEKLNVSPKTVENQIGIALKKLRELLKPHYQEIFSLFLLLMAK